MILIKYLDYKQKDSISLRLIVHHKVINLFIKFSAGVDAKSLNLQPILKVF